MAGFIVYNDAGTVQFTADIRNFCVTQKGTVSTWTTFSSLFSLRAFTVVYTPTGSARPICAVRSTGAAIAQYSVTFASGQWTFVYLAPTSVSSIDYWVFDELPNVPVSVGLNLWNASGNLIYASNAYPLRIQPPLINSDMPFDWWDSPGGPATGGIPETWNLIAGRNYAVFFAKPSHVVAYYYLGAGDYSLGSAIVSARSISGGLETDALWNSRESGTTTSPNGSLERRTLSRSLIPIDVTNY